MKYRNTKTGVVIEVQSKITGGFWKLVQNPPEKKEETTPSPKRKVKKNE